MWIESPGRAFGEIVLKGSPSAGERIRTLLRVPAAIEERMRAAQLAGSVAREMDQRVDSTARHVRVAGQVPCGAKQRMRVTSLGSANEHVVPERIGARARDVRVLVQIPSRVEQGFDAAMAHAAARRVEAPAQ